MKDVRILLADDHEVVRHGVRLLIEKTPGWIVCGEANTGREVVALAAELQPDADVIFLRATAIPNHPQWPGFRPTTLFGK